MDDILTKRPENPSRFIDQLRAFIRVQGLALKQKKRISFGRSDLVD